MQYKTAKLTDISCLVALPASSCGLLTATIRSACSSVTRYSNNCNRFSTDDKRWEIGPSARQVYGHPDQANQQFTPNDKCSASKYSIKHCNSIKVQWKNTNTSKALMSVTHIFYYLKCTTK